jgi:acetoacetate decarboxylase
MPGLGGVLHIRYLAGDAERIAGVVTGDDAEQHGAWSGPCALDIQPHALAPMINLPVLEVVSRVHLIADFTLPFGEVVHDYLA